VQLSVHVRAAGRGVRVGFPEVRQLVPAEEPQPVPCVVYQLLRDAPGAVNQLLRLRLVALLLGVQCSQILTEHRQQRVGRWRWPVTIGGLAGAVFGVWVLGSVAFNLGLLLSVRPEQMEAAIRREMVETNGEEPTDLHMAPTGWWRMTGTAESDPVFQRADACRPESDPIGSLPPGAIDVP
jgi:hypothetical protein